MADKSWKRWERKVAKMLGGVRTGPRGFGLPDVSGIDLAPECKEYSRPPSGSDPFFKQAMLDAMQQAEENAKGRPWIVAARIRERNGRETVVMPFHMFAALFRRAYPEETT